ncbi:unnamed protein product [Rotaria sordida]|uniref:Uncharacterized protein n=1 Tax=Rotaria sordida TaxID=392033 RepID=A0A820HVR9_9BILA|nr:unnamed protein product [Rotaria sordida]CAF4297947.1 unnamed protein product [Rotaria sordida]
MEPLYIPKDYHIVIDNSNVFLGSQKIYDDDTGSTKKNPAIRVIIKNLAKILETDRLQIEIRTRIVGGSNLSEEARVWEEWKSCGYKCILGARLANNKVSRVLGNYHIKIIFPLSPGSRRGRYVTRSNLRPPSELYG